MAVSPEATPGDAACVRAALGFERPIKTCSALNAIGG
jgi:hypothetical protein